MSFGHDIAALVANFERGLLAKNPRWPRVKLSEVASLLNGFAYESAKFSDANGTPLLRIRDILRGRTETCYNGRLDDPRMFKVRNGDLVVGMDGDFNARIWEGGEALLNQRVCLIRAREEIYSQKFLAYVLPGYLRLINDNTSSVTVKHLSSKTVQDTPLPFPPLAEQQRIVARVDALFAEINEGEDALATARKGLDAFRRALLKAAVTGELTKDWRSDSSTSETGHDFLAIVAKDRAKFVSARVRSRDDSIPPIDASARPALPLGWAWGALGAVAEVGTGGTPLRSNKEYWENGDIPWFTSAATNYPFASVPNEFITKRALAETNCRIYPAGTLLVAMYGEGKTRGQVTELEIPAACNQACAALQFANTSLRQWIKLWFGSFYLQLRAQAAGGVQPNLNLEIIKSLSIPIPPLAEVKEVLRRVSEALAICADVLATFEMESVDAERLRKSILTAAFEGRLVAQDVADEPATALLARFPTNPLTRSARRGRPRKSAS